MQMARHPCNLKVPVPQNRGLLTLTCPLRGHNLGDDPTPAKLELVNVAPRSPVDREIKGELLASMGPRKVERRAARAPGPLKAET